MAQVQFLTQELLHAVAVAKRKEGREGGREGRYPGSYDKESKNLLINQQIHIKIPGQARH